MTEGYDEWIGLSRDATDIVTNRLVAEYEAVLTGVRGPGAIAPGLHWCLAPEILPPADLGRDGHPRTGLVLPRLPLPRRMWAGGAVTNHAPLAPGDEVLRRSTIEDVTLKEGRSGRLGFVTVNHLYTVGDKICIEERQDIVYRSDPDKNVPGPSPQPGEEWNTVSRWQITTDPTLLFRYSAVTFNGHRIHYDHPYATGVEGYDGLVVHGPLQACWMQNLAAETLGQPAARFDFRGLSPLTVNTPVTVEARAAEGNLQLRVRRDDNGVVTMQGTATP